MHLALPGTGSEPVAALAAASPRRLLDGQHALIAVIAGVTWLALVGGVLSSYILSNGSGGEQTTTRCRRTPRTTRKKWCPSGSARSR